MPPEPVFLDYVWLAFVDLAGSREVAFSAGPITYREIEAYQAQTHAQLRAWDVALIRRLDNAVRNIAAGGKPRVADSNTDVKGLKAMLRGAVARLQKRQGGQQ